MAIAAHALLVADGGCEGLPQGDADVLDRMVGVDVQVASGRDINIHEAVTGDLVKHVIQKRHAGDKRGQTAAIEIQANPNLRFLCIAGDFSGSHACGFPAESGRWRGTRP